MPSAGGGGGVVRLFEDGTKRTIGRTTSTAIVPSSFVTTWFRARTKSPRRCRSL